MPSQPAKSAAMRAARDFSRGLASYWIWAPLALADMRRRFFGSRVGVFWLTLSTAFVITAIGLVFGRALSMPPKLYIPQFAIGWIVWQFISGILGESSLAFLNAAIIAATPMPLSVHVYRLVFRNLIVLLYNLPVIAGVFLIFHVQPGMGAALALAGLFLLLANAFWVVTLVAVLGAHFRDLQSLMGLFVQLLFFLTPVLWPARALGSWQEFERFNPAALAIEVIRAPLLGMPVPLQSWQILSSVLILGSLTGFGVFAAARARIPYWL